MHQFLVKPDFVKTWVSLVHFTTILQSTRFLFKKGLFPQLNTNYFCGTYTKPYAYKNWFYSYGLAPNSDLNYPGNKKRIVVYKKRNDANFSAQNCGEKFSKQGF